MEAAIETSRRAADRLGRSLSQDRGLIEAAIGDPDGHEDAETSRALDAFVQRFQQLHEHLTQRLLPALFRLESFGERPPPLRTLATQYEGANILPRAADWGVRAEIRNRLVHEYPLDPVDRAKALALALEHGAGMISDFDRVLAYVNERRLMEISDE